MQYHGFCIDPHVGFAHPPLYWGAHFANDRLFVEEGVTPNKKGRNQRKNNAKFVGLQLIATSEIRPREEICAPYNYKN